MIICIVLHRVVQTNCIDFEDITIASLKRILSRDDNKYISIEDVTQEKEKSNSIYYLITFDDGSLSDFNIVYPILKQLNIKATFFINPHRIGENGYISWRMVREMSEGGMCIGSHSNSHPNMTKISFEDAKQELINSKKIITSKIEKNVLYFSFPYGSHNNKLVKLAIKCGYKKCFVSSHGVYNSVSPKIHRNSINRSMSFHNIDEVLNCSLRTRLKWQCEDAIKRSLKKLFGVKFYTFLRSFVLL